MLHLLTGEDRTILSQHLMERLCRAAAENCDGQILIVPEQFSHEAERRLCEVGGDTVSRYAEVLSLSRLYDRVTAFYGGAAKPYLDKGGRFLTMALAAEQVASRIKLYAAALRRPEFLTDMLRMIEEFRSYCVEPSQLIEASCRMEGQFAQKLEELGLLYEAYLAVCANGSADPSDKVIRLAEVLQDTDWALKRTFFVDGFSDFTTAELAVLEALIGHGREVYLALATGRKENVLQQQVWKTAAQLREVAAGCEVSCETQWIDGVSGRDPAIQDLLCGLFGQDDTIQGVSERIILSGYNTVEEECRGAALRIKKLLSQGARCRDISVACTEPAVYEGPLRAVLRMAGLPAYFAGETDVLSKPVLRAILDSLAAAAGAFDYEDVALYLKSGLPELDQDSCDRLDDYAYRWNLRGSQWEQPWQLHPRGFGELWSEEDRERLNALNREKELALLPLIGLRHGLHGAKNTGQMVLALSDFLDAVHLRERMEQEANRRSQSGQGQMAQELLQVYEILRQSLEQTWLTLQDTVRTPDEFCRLYRSLLTQYRVATIPAGLDQIHVSDLPDLRQRTTKHLLILGAADGCFPAYQTGEGLLTEDERKQLMLHGLQLAPNRADQMNRELCRIWSAMYAAQETMAMSYAGEQPAWLFRRAAAMYPASQDGGGREIFLDLPSLAAWRIRHEDNTVLDLPDLDTVEAHLRRLSSYGFTPLRKGTVQGLYGRQIYLSASRIDKYAACRFAFFLAYGLKAKPRKQAKMDPSVFGTFVHAVLEGTVKRVKEAGGFRTISQEQLLTIATEEIDAYAKAHFPEQEQRAAYLFRRSQAEILDIVLDLGKELQNSLFQPEWCELEFSQTGQLPPIEIQGEDALCRISGFVDRVDLYETDGNTYVRVVDYKTGQKDFDYTDILNGAGLQMLVYLFALRQYGAEFFRRSALEPAGVLYLPARKTYTLTPPMPDAQQVAKEHQKERRRRGLIRGDEALLAAMEADPENPQFMPYEMGKHGPKGDLADSRQMILLERHVIRTLARMTDDIASGDVAPDPVIRGQYTSCRFCDYVSVCHGDLCSRKERRLSATTAARFWEKLEQEETYG